MLQQRVISMLSEHLGAAHQETLLAQLTFAQFLLNSKAVSHGQEESAVLMKQLVGQGNNRDPLNIETARE